MQFHKVVCGDLNHLLIISHSAVDLNLDIGGLSVNTCCNVVWPESLKGLNKKAQGTSERRPGNVRDGVGRPERVKQSMIAKSILMKATSALFRFVFEGNGEVTSPVTR